tara:strand:- start:1534 stop:2658 length:1125 start_codon:yes stop_codon:yes gene_type:complete
MLIKKVFSPKTASCIHAALAHLCMSSKRHQEDKKWFDKFGERLALSFHDGKELLLNVESLAKLRSVFRGVKKLKDQQREKRKTPRKSKRNPKPPSLGVHLIWSRPDSYNALFWAFPEYQQRHLLSDCFRIFKELISERIGSASMMLAQHTDTIRPHEELIGCKYGESGKQLFGFKGISNTEKFATPKAVQLAMRGLPFPDDCYDWQARMSYVLLAKAKERIRDLFWGLEPEERVRIIGEAMTYYHLLRTCTTDVTLYRRVEFQQELGDLGMDDTLPVRSQAYEEFHLLLGNDPSRSRAEPFPLSAPLEVVEGESLWDRINAVSQRRKKAKENKDYEQAILSHRAYRSFERSTDIDDAANEYDIVPKPRKGPEMG